MPHCHEDTPRRVSAASPHRRIFAASPFGVAVAKLQSVVVSQAHTSFVSLLCLERNNI